MIRDYPKMLYRADGADIVHFVVTTPESHEAAVKEGWGSRKEAVAAAEKAPKPAPAAKAPAGSDKATLELITKLDAAQKALASKDEIIAAKDGVIEAQSARIAAVESFLAMLRDDKSCPDDLKAAIAELIGAPAAPAAAVKAVAKGKK
jgi:hypothetical protein